VKANGGGTTTAREFGYDINPTGGRANCSTLPVPVTATCVAGYFGGSPYFGSVDLNGDGDIRDQVTVLAPSQTHTDRFGVIAGLRWVINDNHQARFSYTLDYAKHRQTGEVGLLNEFGEPFDVFPINDGLHTDTGFLLEKRDRKSKAILNQVSAEYRGEFIDDRLTVNVGLRLPFFTRDLKNNCFTSSASGFVECSGGNAALDAIIAANNPYVVDPITGRVISGYSPPQHRKLKYDDILPNVGFVFDITPRISAFGNYAKGLSVPSTDNLYNAFFFPEGSEAAKPDPETTNSFDGGLRYRSTTIQAQAGLWMTKFKNRTASAYDPELNATVYRNLGTVDKWGIDGSIAWSPIKQFTGYVFGSWMDSEIKNNIQIGNFGGITNCDNIAPGTAPADIVKSCAFTAGNRESGAPKYTYGFSATGTIGPVDLGFTAKRTGPRYIFDNNALMYSTGVNLANLNDANATNDPTVVFDNTAPAYWLVNLDARLNMKFIGLKETYFQLNVYNLFDKFYVGGFGGGLSQALNTAATQYGNPPFVQIGAPRTVSGSLSISF
jgi:iron complex outermembrane receptor protein